MKPTGELIRYIKTITIYLYLCSFFVICDLSPFSLTCNDTISFFYKSENCPACLALCYAVDATAFADTIEIDSSNNTIIEGETGIIRICREICIGDLRVNLFLGGNAMLDGDYVLRGTDSFDTKWITVIIPDGRNFLEIIVEAMDDVHAEAEEMITLTLQPGEGYTIDAAFSNATITIPQNDFVVTTADDAGEGSLRQAILNANAIEGPNIITFDTTAGPFTTPQKINLNSELPELADELTIDGYIEDRLWQPTGVTVSGINQYRVFHVASGANVTIRSLTIADGQAWDGAGIANSGTLTVKGVTFAGNAASHNGGGLANLEGTVTVINSTFAHNRAANAGGGLADKGKKAVVTNCTFSNNNAIKGGGIFSNGNLLLRNTILANSECGMDCVARGAIDPASTNNLIETNDGCGKPISTADPGLQALGGYNGPTHTFPLSGGSPAINLGDNASALDEHGEPLTWDQRGNGDPRFVGGITDIGAFEHQAYPYLIVDTFEDTELRACTRTGAPDCSLRGAIVLANATSKADVIMFDPGIFSITRAIMLTRPLPKLETDITIDGSGTAGVILSGNGRFTVLNVAPDAKVRLNHIMIENDKPPKRVHRPWGGCLFPLLFRFL